VIRRFNHNESLVAASSMAVNLTFEYHGAPSGTILGDEIQRDLAPYMGSELCTAVETGYSLAYLYHTLGANHYADRAELVIYNAMPVMMTGDMWAHQYMDQPNGPWTTNNTKDLSHPHGHFLFTTSNSGAATTFGMEPQYPCCTVNHPQGYPKFVTHSWGHVGNGGLAHVLLGPSKVQTDVATIECETAYPFDHTLRYTVESSKGLDLYVRVPLWYDPDGSSINIGGSSSPLRPDLATGMHKINVPSGVVVVTYTIGAAIRTEARANNTVAVYLGNILYALDVGSTNTSSYPHPYKDASGSGLDHLPFPQLRDYYVTSSKAWNVAIDPSTLRYHGMAGDAALPTPLFEYGAPPTYMTVQGCEIAWGLFLEQTPDVVPADRTCLGEASTYKLIPYGSAKVHMSELPVVEL
jgi:Beta-L-arabinofuranosidase, GH127